MLNLFGTTLRIQDLFDIIVVAVLFYFLLKFIRETRISLLIYGVIALIVTQQLSQFFGLYTLNYILKGILDFGIIAAIIVFQPEIRRALEKMGNTTFAKFFRFIGDNNGSSATVINGICDAVGHLSKHHIGSLIVIEKNTKIDDIISSGVQMDSLISSELLINIFSHHAPLHDGAVIVREMRIAAAACLLPLTLNPNLSTELGTRHRAAIGVSEVCDCVVIVTSEETGVISVAKNGSLTRRLTTETLKKMLSNTINEENKKEESNEA